MKIVLQPSVWILFLFTTVNAIAQQSSITGRVVDESGSAIPFAHLLLFRPSGADSFLKGAVADSSGRFEIWHELSDSLFLRVQAIGFKDHITNPFLVQRTISLGTLALDTDTETLDEVTVTARKPLFEQRIDRTVVNVQSSVTNIGNNVLNILSKSPAVRVNRSTNEIALMGKQGVVIMIDNKQVRLEAEELLNLLESMTSDNIATIELITAPPANFDAQGNAGIINITTIRGREGFSGQVSANVAYGKRPKFGGSVNLSYQKGKVYSYANISSSTAYDLEKVTIFTGSEELGMQSDLSVHRKPRTGLHSAEIGLDYQLTSKTIVGVVLSALKSDWVMDSRASTLLSTETGTSFSETISYEENKLLNTFLNFNIRHTFSPKTELSFDYDRIQFERKNPTDYRVRTLANDSLSLFSSSARTPVTVQVFKSDLKHRVNNKFMIEAGLKGTFSDFRNHVHVAFEKDGMLENDPRFTDVFEMNEEIYAAYASADWKLNPHLSVKGGLRYEYYKLDLSSIELGQITSRHQGNLFPSMYLTYQLGKHRELNLSYVNRIQRPGFMILAPYFYFFDQNTLFTGNPAILPARSNQYQLGFSNASLTTSLQFTRESMPVFDLQPTLDDELGLFIIKPVQGGTSKVLSLNVGYSFEIMPWWSLRVNTLGSMLSQDMIINDVAYDRSSLNGELTATQNWSIGKIAELELMTGYYSPLRSGVMKVLSRSQVDIGVRKRLKSGASFSFNVNDVFNKGTQWPMVSDLESAGMAYRFKFDAEGPVFRLNFSMPIGNQLLKERGKRSAGAEEEQRRLN